MNITEFRRKYPQYNDLNDNDLADALHRKFYSDIDRVKFEERFRPSLVKAERESQPLRKTLAETDVLSPASFPETPAEPFKEVQAIGGAIGKMAKELPSKVQSTSDTIMSAMSETAQASHDMAVQELTKSDEYEYRPPGIYKGTEADFASPSGMLRQFTGNLLNEAGMGLPEAISGAELEAPSSTEESIAAGVGKLAGFIIGAPGKITKLVMEGIKKAAPRLATSASEGLLSRVGKKVATDVPALGVGFMSSAIGEATKQDNLQDALNVLGDAFVSGAEMGATFGVVQGAIPTNRIARIATGIALLDAQRGTQPLDDRKLNEKIFDYGIDTFFLWHGLGNKGLDAIEKELRDKGVVPVEEKPATREEPTVSVSKPEVDVVPTKEVTPPETEGVPKPVVAAKAEPQPPAVLEEVKKEAEPVRVKEPVATEPPAPLPAEPVKAGEAKSGGSSKAPWEMTREEYVSGIERGIRAQTHHGGLTEKQAVTMHTNAARTNHATFVRQALSESKPVPPEVLKDYPDLKPEAPVEGEGRKEPAPRQPKEKPDVTPDEESITVEGKGKEKTVKADIPKSEAEALPPKKQKEYLLAEIDKAIEEAPDGEAYYDSVRGRREYDNEYVKREYQERKAKHGVVTIEVPGDGKFTILNTKNALTRFRDNAKKNFPATAVSSKPSRPSMPSTKPTGKRIIFKDGEGEYYNEFRPRKEGLITSLTDDGQIKAMYTADGFYSDGFYGVAVKNPGKVGKGTVQAIEAELLPKLSKDTSPATIVGESSTGGGSVMAHAVTAEGVEGVFDAKYIDSILSVHPTAKPFLSADGTALTFRDGKSVVGVAMKLTVERPLTELFPERYAEVLQDIGKDEKPAPKRRGKATKEDVLKSTTATVADTPPVSITAKPVELSAIGRSTLTKELVKAFDVPTRIGRFRQKASGIYKRKEQVVRVGKPNDVATIIHEYAHHFERLLDLPPRMPDEVKAMAYEGAKNLNREGFAEFVREYVLKPESARVKAPNFYKTFEEALSRNPRIQEVIVKARQMNEAYEALSDLDKLRSTIKYGKDMKAGNFTLNELYRMVVDELYPLKLLTDKAESVLGRKLTPQESPFAMAWLLRGMPRKAEQYLKFQRFQKTADGVEFTGEALEETLRPIEKKGLLPVLDAYLVAKRVESDPRLLEKYRHQFSEANIKQVVSDVEANYPDVHLAAKEMYRYCDDLLTYLTNSGRISIEDANRMREKNEFYAPLYEIMEEPSPVGGTGKATANLFNPLKRMTMRAKGDVQSPVEIIIRNTYAIINAAERNEVGNALIAVSKIPGMGKFIEKLPPRMQPFGLKRSELYDIIYKYGTWKETTTYQEIRRELGERVSEAVRESDGATTPEKMEKVALEALKARGWTEAEAKQVLVRIKSAPSDAARQQIVEKTIEKTLLTTISRELGIEIDQETINVFRPKYVPKDNEIILYDEGRPSVYQVDPWLKNAILRLDSDTANTISKVFGYPAKWLRAGATLSPEFVMRNPFRDQFTAYIYSKYGYKPFVDLFRGIGHMVMKTNTWQQFNASGAAHAALVSLDRNYLTKNYRELIERRHPVNYLRNPLKAAQVLSELMEEGTRVGEFARALKKEGKDLSSVFRAGMAARDITLDFSRIGAKTRSLNAIYAFWNANVQGLDKFGREMKNNPEKVMLRAFIGCTLPSVLLWAAQQDDPYYQEIPAWRRVLFWNIVTHKEDGSLAHIWSVPKPFELGLIFGSSFEMMLDYWKHQDPDGAKEFASSLLNSVNPFGESFLPTGLLPFTETATNQSFFFGGPIVPRDKEDLEPYLQYSGRTSESVKAVARMLKDVPGLKEIASPAKVEHLIFGYTAGVGRVVVNAFDNIIKEAGLLDVPPEPLKDIGDVPGIRAFYQRFPTTNARSIEQFYQRYTEAQRRFETLATDKGIRRLPVSSGTAREIVESAVMNDPELMEAKVELERYKGAANVLSLCRRSLNFLYESRDINSEDKTEKRDMIILNMINIARTAIGKPPMGVIEKTDKQD